MTHLVAKANSTRRTCIDCEASLQALEIGLEGAAGSSMARINIFFVEQRQRLP
jgi:hypothetical protein